MLKFLPSIILPAILSQTLLFLHASRYQQNLLICFLAYLFWLPKLHLLSVKIGMIFSVLGLSNGA
jgi:hypothetical protein